MPGTPRAATPTRSGQAVDPAALAAFYRMRSESLTDSHTTAVDTPTATPPKPAPAQPPMTMMDYLISALAGHPGKR